MHSMLQQFLYNNKKLTLIRNDKRDKNRGKAAYPEWPTKSYTDEQINRHHEKGGNIAWVLGDTDLVIDVDVIGSDGKKKHGAEYQKKLFEELNIELSMSAKSGSGGYYYYLTLPHPMPHLRKTLKEYPHIDFLKKGNYVIIPPSIHAIWNKPYKLIDNTFKQQEAPESLINKLSSDNLFIARDVSENKENEFLESLNLSSLTFSEIQQYLNEIDPDTNYTTWIRCGMALHYFDKFNNTTKGFNLWSEWSEKSDKYPGIREMKYKWNSFNSDHLLNNNKVKPETIQYLAKEERIDKKVKETKSSTEIEWKNRWCRDNSDKNCMVEIENPINRVTMQHFNTQFIHSVPPKIVGNKVKQQKPYDYLTYEGYLKFVNFTSYRPDIPQRFFKEDGLDVLNAFTPTTVPPVGSKDDPNYKKVVKMFSEHLSFLCSNNNEDTQQLLYWLAHNVQFPGKLIKWAVLLKGEETNTGKTWVGAMLEKVLGDNNYKVINTSDVQSDFNEWATGACVVLIDEIKMPGESRYTIANKLKPYITNNKISVNKKGVSVHKVKNTTNYIATSNEHDAIPMLEDQSRWFPIHVYGHKTLEQKQRHNAMLIDLLDNYSHLIAAYLHQVKIPTSFARRDAPQSSHLKETQQLEKQEMLGGEYALELLNNPTENDPWNDYVVNTTAFFNSLYFTDPDSVDVYKKSPKRKGLFFKRLGYPYTFKVIENGKNITYRTKNKVRTIEEIHYLLGLTPNQIRSNQVKSDKTPNQIRSNQVTPPYNPDDVKTNWCGKQTLDVLDEKTNTIKNICVNPDNYTFDFETGYFIHKETKKIKKRLSKKDSVYTWVMVAPGEKPERSENSNLGDY